MPSEPESAATRCWVEISQGALRGNLQYLRKRVGKSRLLAVVKADAYGHGLAETAALFVREGVDFFCVASLEEGIALRAGGVGEAGILVFSGFRVKDYPLYRDNMLVPTLGDFSQFAQLNTWAEKNGQQAVCHLKVDSGMGRFGITAAQVAAAPERIFQLPAIQVLGIYSHLSSSGDSAATADHEFTMEQIRIFRGLADFLELNNIWSGMRHLLNSGGILGYPQASLDGVRPGLALYGCYPGPLPRNRALVPAMSFKANVLQVRELPAGVPVGYDRTFKTQKPLRMALVGAGYADGYPVSLSNRGRVQIGRKLYPVIGRVCMDTLMVDVTGAAVKPGMVATLWGDGGPGAEAVAAEAATIPYELLCRISGRVPRRFIR